MKLKITVTKNENKSLLVGLKGPFEMAKEKSAKLKFD